MQCLEGLNITEVFILRKICCSYTAELGSTCPVVSFAEVRAPVSNVEITKCVQQTGPAIAITAAAVY